MEAEKYQIDDLDRKILRELYKDARASFVDIAKKLTISNATVHQRVNKMKLHGVLKGFQPVVDEEKLGLTVTSIIGVYLKNAKDCQNVLDKLEKIPEGVEAYYTTGSYALILKVVSNDIQNFQTFLMEKLQHVSEVQSTESFICLSKPIHKNIKI
jgi:Lrp/AsnC family transcriptional regulator for asnA, asnC and gidA